MSTHSATTPTIHMQRPSRAKAPNPLQTGILQYFKSCIQVSLDCSSRPIIQAQDLPKRYTLYAPLLLLPPNFTTFSPAWRDVYAPLSQTEKADLFISIAAAFGKQGPVTHIAINAPIPLDAAASTEADPGLRVESNVMRSPTGLVPVYGDFGTIDLNGQRRGRPTQQDFDTAFWVTTSQHRGIVQTWAPLWTMFSRGNVKEKGRILGERGDDGFIGLSERNLENGEELSAVDVVDFYIGIGYFAFSYLDRGVRRVWGWEINGWSVEGLRRGCERNGWGVLVVRVDDDGTLHDSCGNRRDEVLRRIVEMMGSEDQTKGTRLRCLAFWGDNKWARRVLGEIKSICEAKGQGEAVNVRHANLGLLPTSRGSWRDAVAALDALRGGWIHVHENADEREIESKRGQIVAEIADFVKADRGESWVVVCCHVEEVKTFAPRIVHLVFDIQISPR